MPEDPNENGPREAEMEGKPWEPAKVRVEFTPLEANELLDFVGSCDTSMSPVLWKSIWRKLLEATGHEETDWETDSPDVAVHPPQPTSRLPWDPEHLSLVHAIRVDCPHCVRPLSVEIEYDRDVVALTTILSGFYNTVQPWEIETCFEQGSHELEKRTSVRVRRARRWRRTANSVADDIDFG